MERAFGDIEIFLATFPEDPNIKKSAVESVSATLKAVENTIGSFLTNSGKFVMLPSLPCSSIFADTWRYSPAKKVCAIVLRGKQYQQDLVDSIDDIQLRSAELVHNAQNSHIEGTKKKLDGILNGESNKLINSSGWNLSGMMLTLSSAQAPPK